jgi:DNA-binding SARP family transcriptional activator
VALNHAVPIDSLIFAVWKDDPPAAALDTLQSIVSRLRRHLGRNSIESVDHSYRLVAEPDEVDAVKFERLMRQASSLVTDDPATAASLATEALELWRGTPFGDLRDEDCLRAEVQRLEALRLGTHEIRLEADIGCGRLTSAIASLQAEIIDHPYRERLWYLLILALARDGRRVDAVRACQRLRADLGDIGLEPSADITELEEMVLSEAPAVRAQLHR